MASIGNGESLDPNDRIVYGADAPISRGPLDSIIWIDATTNRSRVIDHIIKGPTPETTPDAFSFVNQVEVALSTPVISAPITVTGINQAALISVTRGEYSIDWSPFTSVPGTVTNGQTVRVRHTSGAWFSTPIETVLTIGGVSGTFTSTTVARSTPISVTGGEYSVDWEPFTSVPSTVTNGQTVRVRQTTTPTHSVLTIGGVSKTFTTT